MNTNNQNDSISLDNVNHLQLSAIIAEYVIKNNALLKTILAHLETENIKDFKSLQSVYDSIHASEMAHFISRISKEK